MKIRVAASTLAAVSWAAALFAQAADSRHTATGQVLSVGDVSLAVRTAGGGDATAFIVATTTRLPARLAAGSRVTVYSHRVGDREVADRVVLGAVPAPSNPGTRLAANAPPVHSSQASGATGRGTRHP